MDFLDLYVQPKKVKVHESIEFSQKQKMNFYDFNRMDLRMYTVSLAFLSNDDFNFGGDSK